MILMFDRPAWENITGTSRSNCLQNNLFRRCFIFDHWALVNQNWPFSLQPSQFHLNFTSFHVLLQTLGSCTAETSTSSWQVETKKNSALDPVMKMEDIGFQVRLWRPGVFHSWGAYDKACREDRPKEEEKGGWRMLETSILPVWSVMISVASTGSVAFCSQSPWLLGTLPGHRSCNCEVWTGWSLDLMVHFLWHCLGLCQARGL